MAGSHPSPDVVTRADGCLMEGARIEAECSFLNVPLPPSVPVSWVEFSFSGGFRSVSKELVKSILKFSLFKVHMKRVTFFFSS